MKNYIIPLEGFGESIRFGINRDEARGIMNRNFETFKRGGEWGSGIPADFFVNDGIFFYYDKKDSLEAVEFSRESNAIFNNIEIFKMKARDVIGYMYEMDGNIIIGSDGATSREFSLGLWAPDLDEDADAFVESFLVGRSGYYDAIFE